MEQSFAVVTGASRGLGQSFARELARRKINLILMSLPGQGLDVLAADLERQFGIRVVFRETDLCSRENVLSAASWINEHYPVSILINNAGIGGTKKFEDASAAYIEKMIQLNVTATSLLTHQLLPNLQQQHYAHVLNVASIAALSPVGYKTVYPASKAFINFFSRGLNQELKGTNVSVSVVNPGAMATNPEISARINKQGFFGKLILLDPDRVAKRSIAQILKRNPVVSVNSFLLLALLILPAFIRIPLMTNVIKRELVW